MDSKQEIEVDGEKVDQVSAPKEKRIKTLSLAQATEAVVLHDGKLGKIEVPTTADGNRNYQLFMVSIIRAVGRKMLAAAKRSDYENLTPQQLKDFAIAMKTAGEMATQAFQNPEDPSNDIPKEISPMQGIMGKLMKNAGTLANPNSTSEDRAAAFEEIEFSCNELEGDTEEEEEPQTEEEQ